MKLWQNTESLDSLIESFTTGLDPQLDMELIPYDCLGTIAHVKMLGSLGYLTHNETESLVLCLEEIREHHATGHFHIHPDQEDGHTAIECYLIEKLGDTGKKVHTGRSRNDQVLTAIRLYEKDFLSELSTLLEKLISSMNIFATGAGSVPMPGYTHTRKAMPFSVAEWIGATALALSDDQIMIQSTLELIDRSPLGSGAGYGVPLPLDRQMTASLMGFSQVMDNPAHAQNSRGKLESRILNDCSMILLDLNRWASDIILFTLPEIGYFGLKADLVTGSSIMPHKQNPDVLELIRASYHQLNGYEWQMKALPANLISGYHRDMQLTKEPLMRGLHLTRDVIAVSDRVIDGLVIHAEKLEESMTEELSSVRKAIELVKTGMPFRDAYHQISKDFRNNQG